MDAHKLWMLRDFIGTNKVLFRIPVYQRNYDWSESNCNRLLDDIYGIMQSGDKHFLGTIVFMAAKSGGFALREYIIIDGQQRLTTLMLILKALSVVAESVGDDCYHEIEEQYLHNKYCDEEFKVKLKPIKSDNNQFLLLLEDKIDEMDEDTHIYHNFMLCKERFERWAEKGINPSHVLVDMWITGFDVPSLAVMYIDKPLQKHTLIQTISRVNRVFDGKDKGLVVDYIGIKNDMLEAVKKYGSPQESPVDELNITLGIFRNHLAMIDELLIGFNDTKFYAGEPLERLTCLNMAAE